MKKKVRKINNNFVKIALVFIISSLIFLFLIPNKSFKLVQDDFLVTFLGVILSLIITIITFIYSSLGKISDLLDKCIKDSNDQTKEKVHNLLNASFNELIEDMEFMFYIYIGILLIIILGQLDLPHISWQLTFISKQHLLSTIKFGLLINALFAVSDCFMTLKNLMKLTVIKHN